MNAKEIVKDIMKSKEISNADMAHALNISPATVFERLKTSKIVKGKEQPYLNITIGKLNDMLRYLGYDLVVMPRGRANKIEGAYLIDDTEGVVISRAELNGTTSESGKIRLV